MFQLSINVTLHYSNHMHDHSHRGRLSKTKNEKHTTHIRLAGRQAGQHGNRNETSRNRPNVVWRCQQPTNQPTTLTDGKGCPTVDIREQQPLCCARPTDRPRRAQTDITETSQISTTIDDEPLSRIVFAPRGRVYYLN